MTKTGHSPEDSALAVTVFHLAGLRQCRQPIPQLHVEFCISPHINSGASTWILRLNGGALGPDTRINGGTKPVVHRLDLTVCRDALDGDGKTPSKDLMHHFSPQ